MNLLVVLVSSTIWSHAIASNLEATSCNGNCGTTMYVAGTVNKPLFDLKDALQNNTSLNGSPRAVVNSDQASLRLPLVYITGSIGSSSGGYVSPCKVLTAKHGIVPPETGIGIDAKVMISSETDSTGQAINLREARVEELPGRSPDLIILHDPQCEGGKIGYFRFMHFPPEEGTKDNSTVFVGFPSVPAPEFNAKTLAVTKCNSRRYRDGLLYHDCFGPPGSSGGFLSPIDGILQGTIHRTLKVKVYLAQGVHTNDRNASSNSNCDESTCNIAIDGGVVENTIRSIVRQDITDYSKRVLTSQNQSESQNTN